MGALSIQPNIPEISVGTSNGTDHFGWVRPEYSGPALKVVHFDRPGARFSKIPLTFRALNQIFKSNKSTGPGSQTTPFCFTN